MRKIRGSRVPLRAARPGWSVLSGCTGSRLGSSARAQIVLHYYKALKSDLQYKRTEKIKKK
jgi:hypothetical protein